MANFYFTLSTHILFISLFMVFQNPYTAVRPMDIGIVKE
jgi:hypothetical protein